MESCRILLVEDESIIALDLQQQLEDCGYQVVGLEASGPAAIASADRQRPDLVVMDIVIRGSMDGIAAAAEIRRARDVPVLFLTAYGDAHTLRRAKAVGPCGYLLKPFRTEELQAMIEVALCKHRLEVRLRESEHWFAKTLRCISDGVVATDAAGVVRFMNPTAEALTGWRHDEAAGRPVAEVVQLITEAGRSPVRDPTERAVRERRAVQLEDAVLLVNRDGREVLIDDGAAPIAADDGTPLGGVLVFRDVTARRGIEAALRESEERFRSAFDHAAVGMALVALDGRILRGNRALSGMLDRSETGLVGQQLEQLIHADDLDAYGLHRRALLGGGCHASAVELRLHGRRAEVVWVQLNASVVQDERRAPLYLVVQMLDVTERRRSEERLRRVAHFDALTGLANREQLGDHLTRAVAVARRRHGTLGVLFVDLDEFKRVNDSLGHRAGDDLLMTAAQRIREAVRDTDLVARWGGDEFVVVAESPGDDEQLASLARRVLAALVKPVSLGEHDASVTASVGIATWPRGGATASELLASADAAMYAAKEAGKNRFAFALPEQGSALLEQLRLEHALRYAVAHDELRLRYQPIVRGGRIRSVEALLRWQHPQRGLLSPAAFIAQAEKTGVIVPLGIWVLETACAQVASWRRGGASDLGLAVNLSARQLREPDLVAQVERVLERTGLPPGALELEITESCLMSDGGGSVSALEALRARGVGIAVDDFGTGYSSLAYLRRLPLDRLKIDRSFVSEVPGEPGGEAILRAIVSLARNLDLGVVAEGVETEAQLAFVNSLGCNEVQGFLLWPPLAAEELEPHVIDAGGARRAC
jgi:diguanylate cyclase (GGDEF)-like protein/PAS domain S-box-containing protein